MAHVEDVVVATGLAACVDGALLRVHLQHGFRIFTIFAEDEPEIRLE